jgi:hypothetical protein
MTIAAPQVDLPFDVTLNRVFLIDMQPEVRRSRIEGTGAKFAGTKPSRPVWDVEGVGLCEYFMTEFENIRRRSHWIELVIAACSRAWRC